LFKIWFSFKKVLEVRYRRKKETREREGKKAAKGYDDDDGGPHA
jgi:hypothetical protein